MDEMSNSSSLIKTHWWLPVMILQVGCLGLTSVITSPQVSMVNGTSETRVWIGVPSWTFHIMKELFYPMHARNLSSGENTSLFTHSWMPFSTASGFLASYDQMMTGASGVFWKIVPFYPVAKSFPEFETAMVEISISCPLKNSCLCLSWRFSMTSRPPIL